jgi:sulfide:quinone oxidoreductase
VRVLILGAGFGGLELATLLSESGERFDVTLVDRSDAFVFGYSKLDVMFGRSTLDKARLPYAAVAKPGVTLLRETVTAIDPGARRVTTDIGDHETDVLVIALGADCVVEATPGLAEHGDEFYSPAGAVRLAEKLANVKAGRFVIGVCDAPYKCPPAPSEAALLLHDHLVMPAVRDRSEIDIVSPLPSPVPPSPDTSAALLEAFAERGITFTGSRRVKALREGVAILDDSSERSFDLFLGVPVHRAAAVVVASGMTVDGYIEASSQTLETAWPGIYAIGDVAAIGVPKAGTFAEGAARVVAAALIATQRGTPKPPPYDGRASCWIEFGGGRVGRVDIDFLSGPQRTGRLRPPSPELVAEKRSLRTVASRWSRRTSTRSSRRGRSSRPG